MGEVHPPKAGKGRGENPFPFSPSPNPSHPVTGIFDKGGELKGCHSSLCTARGILACFHKALNQGITKN